jgi:hypothetical protein
MSFLKRGYLLLTSLFLVVILSACTNVTSTPIEPNENNMIVTIQNKADFEIHGIELAFLNHTQGGVNADGSIIEKGENLRFEVSKEDFELDGKVDMEVFIKQDTTQDSVRLRNKATLELSPDQEVFFELTGTSIDEAKLKRVK